ncbi:Acetyltransferase (GNAT) domain-containing protein [Pedobacter steynii]|uniref:Acetyltransferase (GNAT) domain-containing protein n=1 Tax=Pedobacter steynii TaxID=430522 RepID=A0A1G9Z964_9SPHI|nr:GNAT family N-acetyltransferase [Pedobacter steynii]NQX39971.1 GNAT family N-acetyltransferase [Pedobacter steynii]SDN17156.1 Acetyltransferase (GNAT) domain-containing protein [Pedobacter steynii]
MTINHKNYTFLMQYQNEEKWRESFNSLTKKTYRFDFEKWYQSGYWDEGCLLYSLAEGDKVVSHVTVNVIRFTILGVEKKFVQLGTVMTDPDYRKQGLSRVLMEKVMLDWQDHCDMIYLFANDAVLDFYPKFGFVPVNEYQAVYQLKAVKKGPAFRAMNMDNAGDRDLLFHTAQQAVPLFKISMKDNAGLVMFYAHYFDRFSVSDFLYYITDLNAVVVAEYEEEMLILHDILAPATVDIKTVIHAMARENTSEVTLGFMPENAEDYEISLHKEDNSTLFVQAGCNKLFEDHQLIFPLLSHT